MSHVFLASLLALALFAGAGKKPDRTIHVVAERFTFSPSRIVVKEGSVVELILTSEDTGHGFHLSAANVNAAIPQMGKGELKVRFVASKKGKYSFDCSRACGAGHNLMRGELVVE